MSCHCHSSDSVSGLLLTLLPVPPLLLTRVPNISFCYGFLACLSPVLVVLVPVLTLLHLQPHSVDASQQLMRNANWTTQYFLRHPNNHKMQVPSLMAALASYTTRFMVNVAHGNCVMPCRHSELVSTANQS